MPSISIAGGTVTELLTFSDDSFLGGNALQKLIGPIQEFVAELGTPLNAVKVKQASFSAQFAKSNIALKGNSFGITSSISAKLGVAKPGDVLFGAADFDPVNVAAGECWVSFELDNLLDLSLGIPLPDGFGIGFEGSASPQFATYLHFPPAEAGAITLKQAIADTLGAFTVPLSAEAVLALPVGLIYTSDLTGTAKISGSWSLPISVDQVSLASATLPFNQTLALTPALNVSLWGDITISSEFYIRIRRADPTRLRLALYNKKSKTLDAAFDAAAGVQAGFGSTDLINALFGALDPKIKLDILPSDVRSSIADVIKNAVDHSLAISLNAALSSTISDQPVFVYDLDVSNPGQATLTALNLALKGDWTAVSKIATEVKSVFTHTLEKTAFININVLGLYNYVSFDDFVKSMSVLRNDETHSIVITDQATATRIKAGFDPKVADTNQLRSALLEGFTATATYQALAAGLGQGTSLKVSQQFFAYKDSMEYRDALKGLNAGEVLGVMSASVKTALAHPGDSVAHASFSASCDYSNDDCLKLFFSDVAKLTPRTQADLTKTGRTVLARLLDPQNQLDQARIRFLQDDAAWAAIDANPAQIPQADYSDWIDITWWASALASVGPALKAVLIYAKTVQGDPTKDQKFQHLRTTLVNVLASAGKNEHAAFEPSWPICVSATIAGRNAGNPPPVFEVDWNGQSIFSNKAPAIAKTAGR